MPERQRTTVFIRADGTVVGIYNDVMLAVSGGDPLAVTRVSKIEFNHALQQWEARRVVDNSLLCRNVSREECVRREVEILTEEMQKKLEQSSDFVLT